VIYVKNRLSHRAIRTTSYEKLHDEKSSIKHLQSFEQRCYVHVLSKQRKTGSKLLLRAKEGQLVEYTSSIDKIYRIYISSEKRIVESRQVKFALFEDNHSKKQQEQQDKKKSTKKEKEQLESVVLSLRSWRRVQRTNQQLQQRQRSQESQTDEESEQEKSDPDDNENVFVEAKKHEQRPEIVLPPPSADSEDYEAVSSEQTPEPIPQPRRNSPRESRRAPDRLGMMTTSVMEHAHACASDVMEESLTHHEAMKSLQSDQ